ncbi:MAG: enoyl-CoA hydratase/isomerase family protein [Rhodobacteraceae bacterium]|jgi:enoyl-CoA hydratase/carnithine racemase|nr:enoyl-CoA hydratase/isomerase family protein [Paracoccaceae bacterium]
MDRPIPFADGRLRLWPGRVATIELAVPGRRNAIGQAMWAALPGLCARLAADPAVRVVILAGAPGPDGPVFSAGADIAEFGEVFASPAAAADYNTRVRAANAAVAALPMPVIARIAGACVGGGCGLALACDLRFAAAGARLGITPARLGIGYSFEDTAALVAAVGPSRAKDMLFSARLLDAAEALAIGLVDRVVADGALDEAVAEHAAALAGLAPGTIRLAKATVDAIAAAEPARAGALRAQCAALFTGPDLAEGLAAFRDRRPPRF